MAWRGRHSDARRINLGGDGNRHTIRATYLTPHRARPEIGRIEASELRQELPPPPPLRPGVIPNRIDTVALEHMEVDQGIKTGDRGCQGQANGEAIARAPTSTTQDSIGPNAPPGFERREDVGISASRDLHGRTHTESQNGGQTPTHGLGEVDFGCYNAHIDVEAGQKISKAEIQAAFAHLHKNKKSPPQGRNIAKVEADPKIIAGRIAFMKDRGIVPNTMDLNPSRDQILQWIQVYLTPRFGISFVQVKVLARSLYLLVLEGKEEKLRLLAATPLYLEGRLVVMLPWEPTLDSTNCTHHICTLVGGSCRC
ncbi:unnamed protein product [Calypogeia fissa]